jgi:phytanoyl-CoA hydroxylase
MSPSEPSTTYHSRFGGLWTDRSDAGAEIARRHDAGLINEEQAGLITGFVRDGYVVLKGAVSADVVDRFRNDISRAFEQGDERLLMQFPGGESQPLTGGLPLERSRVVDSYAFYPSAREALFAPAIVEFLKTVFDAPPLLFQSLSFHKGSQQGMHQDTAYVVVSSPLKLAASWIALQDVEPGSGELMYYEGSHRLPEYLFSGRFKHWNSERDGPQQHEEFLDLLNVNADRLGMPRRTFLPRKGDALIWAADLAHGGSPVEDESLTRQSLVGHYCDNRVDPHYFSWAPQRAVKAAFQGSFYSTAYYELPAEEVVWRVPEVPPAADSAAADEPTRPSRRRSGVLGRLLGR